MLGLIDDTGNMITVPGDGGIIANNLGQWIDRTGRPVYAQIYRTGQDIVVRGKNPWLSAPGLVFGGAGLVLGIAIGFLVGKR